MRSDASPTSTPRRSRRPPAAGRFGRPWSRRSPPPPPSPASRPGLPRPRSSARGSARPASMASATIARERGRAYSLALVRAVPVAAWLAGMVTLSAIVRFVVARRMTAPWIMVDELVYSELARGIASGAGYALRGEAVGLGYGAVYPLLISPAYLLDSLSDAYGAAKAINAVLISLAAVPAYLLARRLVSAPLALVVAALSLAVPSLFYAGTIMTENAFYPIFLAAVLLLVRALERPTPLRVGLLLAATGVAFLTRTQAVALVPAMMTAPLLLEAWRGRLRSLLEYRWLYGGAAVSAGLVLAAAAL